MSDLSPMQSQVDYLWFWVLAVGLFLSATDADALHLQDGSSSLVVAPPAAFAKGTLSSRRGKGPVTVEIGTDARRRSGGPSANARFLRTTECGVGCLPPGQLLDFRSGNGLGPPGNLPANPGPPVIVTPLPRSAGLLIAGLTVLAALAARKRRRDLG